MVPGRPSDAENLLRHAAFVRAVARAALHGDDLVDDVVQETWLAALREGRRRGPLAPWLAGVVRNQARSLLRKRKADRRREQRASRSERTAPQQDVVERLEIERCLIRAVEALPERYRTPLVLRYLDDLPPRAISVRLDLPVDTVRTRVRRGLARLRTRLEAEHGGEARGWRLALLYALRPDPSPATAILGASGGLCMVKKVVVPVLALALLAGGVGVVLPGLLRSPSPGRSESAGEIRDRREHADSAPALLGRSPCAPREEAAASADPAEDPGGAASGDSMRNLLASIRRDVAPDWWRARPDLAALEGRNGVVIARAPRDVLDAIARYLDARRTGAPGAPWEPARADVRAVDAARAALRPILRGILEREKKLDLAFAAWGEGRFEEAQATAEEVLAEEPDNVFAEEIRRGATKGTDGAASGSTEGDVERTCSWFEDARGEEAIEAWLMRWPSVRTWQAVKAVFAKWGVAGLGELAPDLDALLDRGSVTLEIHDESLWDAVRRLQIETLADIRLPEGVAEEARRIRIRGFREVARPLRKLLEDLAMRLPEGWTWYAARRHVVLTRMGVGVRPRAYIRYFDVKDILWPGSGPPGRPASPPPPESGKPPVPPVYAPDPDGGPPVLVRDR